MLTRVQSLFSSLIVVGMPVLGVGSTAFAQSGVIGLGFVSESDRTHAFSLSGDGNIIVGSSSPGPGLPITPVRWTLNTGAPVIEVLARPDGWITGQAIATSADGSVAVVKNYDGQNRTYRWDAPDEASQYQLLPEWTSARGSAVTSDGTIYGTAGVGGGRVARWSSSGSPETLPLPKGATAAYGAELDAAGNVYTQMTFAPADSRLVRYTPSGVEILTNIDDHATFIEVSDDGTTAIGLTTHTNNKIDLWVWSAPSGFANILANTSFFSLLTAVTPDGSVVFGFDQPEEPVFADCFAWRRGEGLVSTTDYFAGLGVDLDGWSSIVIRDVSADGTRFVGSGVNPAGRTEACLIVLPATKCAADYNADGFVNSQDFFEFLNAFFAGQADFNADGLTDSQDLFDFLEAFFVGC